MCSTFKGITDKLENSLGLQASGLSSLAALNRALFSKPYFEGRYYCSEHEHRYDAKKSGFLNLGLRLLEVSRHELDMSRGLGLQDIHSMMPAAANEEGAFSSAGQERVS